MLFVTSKMPTPEIQKRLLSVVIVEKVLVQSDTAMTI